MTTLRIGTRGSALAVAQSTTIAERLARETGADVELIRIKTEGDRTQATGESLASLGGTGVFASALRSALLVDECDVVVHSLKDLPTASHPGLVIGATPGRADARDALCARDGLTLETLPQGSRVGTGSPRRAAQLLARRPDLEVVDIRGNVDTRLRRVGDDLDAVLLSAAGLGRLGRLDAATDLLGLGWWPTAPGQGSLAVEVREGDPDETLARGLAAIDDRDTRLVVSAERQVLARLEAGCAAPIGASAVVDAGLLLLSATVYSPEGAGTVSASHAVSLDDGPLETQLVDVAEVAGRVVDELLELGAAELAPIGGGPSGGDPVGSAS
ncbi:hydroxymethylbilane synthase [Frigoribacterium sp. CFBP9039]|uniref:hydroxymethylbilane synthase n=1 Tax=unclassified Frigoribacterium TaxID=2627005 RepID=UPI00177C3FBE|nr:MULTISPECIES: hydroxymethylbilane synthase [unclassified Frigoribacterium]MBD8704303.1 hydroxymethylbilane synthase [Frigoribacterium sp. CFBP 13712]MDY0891557.1 hydroxymethylbilane synthase [Frigoribacterium sp. CFBP9030]MDY0945845.1 hydroxymethylbilane synthase [Frigoribacterium sp. CFBP9039]